MKEKILGWTIGLILGTSFIWLFFKPIFLAFILAALVLALIEALATLERAKHD